MAKKTFEGVWIPAEYFPLLSKLSLRQVVILSMIKSLSKTKGYCDAHNSYFAEILCCDVPAISKDIKALSNSGFVASIVSKKDGNDRQLRVYEKPDFEAKKCLPYCEFDNTPYCEFDNTLLSESQYPIVNLTIPYCEFDNSLLYSILYNKVYNKKDILFEELEIFLKKEKKENAEKGSQAQPLNTQKEKNQNGLGGGRISKKVIIHQAPTIGECISYFAEKGVEKQAAEEWHTKLESDGWLHNGKSIADWKKFADGWIDKCLLSWRNSHAKKRELEHKQQKQQRQKVVTTIGGIGGIIGATVSKIGQQRASVQESTQEPAPMPPKFDYKTFSEQNHEIVQSMQKEAENELMAGGIAIKDMPQAAFENIVKNKCKKYYEKGEKK